MVSPLVVCLGLAASITAQAPQLERPFRIQVVDDATGRSVPLVELETVHHLRFVTDSHGLCAVTAPELDRQRVFFHVRSHGYEYPADGFGYRGFACEVVRGGEHVVRLTRVNIAERLYRVTGAGIYRDTVLLGERAPIDEPLLDGGVLGCDSVVNAIYRGRLWWFWGDTNRAAYPLGNFAVSGATSRLPADGGLAADLGVNLDYFVREDGFARKMCPIEGPGPVWIFGLMVVEEHGEERMLGHYARMKELGIRYEHGIVEWSDAHERFEKVVEFPLDAPLHPAGNPVRVRERDQEWFVFPNPYPVVRVQAQRDAILDPGRYEAFGRASDEAAAWGWRTGAEGITPERALAEPGAEWMVLHDVETGRAVRGHGGTVFWNAHRRRWIAVVLEAFGSSMLGEVWFAEADTLLGPWGYARRIVTHDRYSFYNVKQHPYFDGADGRFVFFEGTYTATFSGNPVQTPLYDYNQVMYRLDLDDPRLSLPVPVYRARDGDRRRWLVGADVDARELWGQVEEVAFHALPPRTDAASPGLGFGVEPVGLSDRPGTVELYRWNRGSEAFLALAGQVPPGEGWDRTAAALGRVWRAPAAEPPLWSAARPASR